jgi:hypothetical protein
MSLEKEVFSLALSSAANSSLDVIFSEELIISCSENKTKKYVSKTQYVYQRRQVPWKKNFPSIDWQS